MTAAGNSPAGRWAQRRSNAPRTIAAVGRRALVAVTWWCCAMGAATAQPVDYTVVPPAAAPGPYPVACDDVDQDFARLRPGEDAASYWEGKPRDDGSSRYVTDLFVQPWSGQVQTVPVPDDRELYGRYRGGSFASAALVCYPTTPANPRADFVLPDGRRVPRMQRGGEAPILPDGGRRWPVLLFSHGLGGSPLGSGYLDFIALFASHGYVVAAPFHGDRRFAEVSLDNVGEILAAIFGFDRFVAMQALRPSGLVATLDRLLAHPQWREVVDAERIGGFGASLGGEAMLLLGGAGLTTSIGQSSKRVLIEPRLKAAVGYIPYFGQSILPAFGRDQHGVDGVRLPYLAIAGTADTTAPLSQIEDGMVRLGSTRQLVTLRGVQHGLEARDVPDILTWSLAFLDGRVRGDAAALARVARMTSVAGGSDDATTLDYSAPTPPAAAERIVVEYHNDALDHYFVTGEAAEAAMLDAGVVVPGWKRTGFEFKAWARDSGSGLPNCRFFGTPGRGPNSHFYTIDAAECAKVKANPDWTFEEIVFAAGLPERELCPADRMTVTRLYNDGKGGQANHRYVTSRSETGQMLAQGWRVEGAVFCTPP
jgi:dienelactone hydrolase